MEVGQGVGPRDQDTSMGVPVAAGGKREPPGSIEGGDKKAEKRTRTT